MYQSREIHINDEVIQQFYFNVSILFNGTSILIIHLHMCINITDIKRMHYFHF